MPSEWLSQGGPIMYALLACSVLSVTVAIERAIFWWRRRHHRDAAMIERAFGLLASGQRDEAIRLIADSHDPVARVVRVGLSHDEGSIEAAIQMAAGHEARAMRSRLRILDTVVTVAPLLGILGTVIGIISSFDVIGGGAIDNPIEVTGGIAKALLTTAAGLVVAIIALIPFNYFSARMEDEIHQLEGHLTTFEIMLEKGRRRED